MGYKHERRGGWGKRGEGKDLLGGRGSVGGGGCLVLRNHKVISCPLSSSLIGCEPKENLRASVTKQNYGAVTET